MISIGVLLVPLPGGRAMVQRPPVASLIVSSSHFRARIAAATSVADASVHKAKRNFVRDLPVV